MNHRPFEKLLEESSLGSPEVKAVIQDGEDQVRRAIQVRMSYLVKEALAGRMPIGMFLGQVSRLEALLPDGEGWRISDYLP